MQELVDSVVADGIVDAEEVKEIRKVFYEDGKIDQEEADAMFEINDGVSGAENDESYQQLFVDVLSDFVLKDDETPGVVDESEGDYLAEKIEGDGNLDDVEKALLANLRDNATDIQSNRLKTLISTLPETTEGQKNHSEATAE